jgi:hypothetical protein
MTADVYGQGGAVTTAGTQSTPMPGRIGFFCSGSGGAADVPVRRVFLKDSRHFMNLARGGGQQKEAVK